MPGTPVHRRPRAALVAYDALRTFEYGVAVEVFALVRPGLEDIWYDTRVVSPDSGPLRGKGGVAVHTTHALSSLARFGEGDTIVLPGWRDTDAPAPASLIRVLQTAAGRGARIVSVCSGAFVLAETGLLDGKRATTHWLYAETFRRRFPAVQYEEDVLYVDEGNLLTSAGSAAGLDACLHLVRRDFGAKIANTVARRMVVPPHREGGQAQFVEAPVARNSGRGVGQAMEWARKRLDQPLRIEDLAQRSAMSERTFLRRFREAAGMTPQAWLTQERVARARDLLEASRLTHDEVARHCGYETTEAFRAAFRKVVGVPPGSYRDTFTRR
jgi:AraC family transcriptional activator FtrA